MEGRGPGWGGFVSLLRWCNTAICSQATEVIMQSAEIKQSQRIAMETNPLIVLPQLGERLPLQQLSAKAEQQRQPPALFTLPVQVCVCACVRTGEQLIYFWMKYKESRPEFSQRAPPSLLQRTLSLWPVDAKFLESSTFIAECRWRFNPLAAAMTSATFLNSVFLILQAKLETFFFFFYQQASCLPSAGLRLKKLPQTAGRHAVTGSEGAAIQSIFSSKASVSFKLRMLWFRHASPYHTALCLSAVSTHLHPNLRAQMRRRQ